jgi:hypothetical protein
MWGSPLKPKREKVVKVISSSQPTKEKENVLEKFKPIKLSMTKSEAKKILDYKKDLAVQQILWVQNWMETLIRERSLPPQLAGADCYSQLCLFLTPPDALNVLKAIRSDFEKVRPVEEKPVDDYSYLNSLELGAYHEHLPPPNKSYHNNPIQDDDL